MAHVSVQIAHDHMATAFHFFNSMTLRRLLKDSSITTRKGSQYWCTELLKKYEIGCVPFEDLRLIKNAG